MMKKLLIPISFLLAGPLAGDDHFDRGVLRVLDEANKQRLVRYDRQLCLPLMVNGQSVPASVLSREMNDCVIALCGKPSENKSAFVTDANFDQYINPEIKKQLSVIAPLFKKILEKEKQAKLKHYDELQSKISMTNPEKWSSQLRSEISHKMFKPYMTEKIDLKKPLSERFSVELKNDKNLSPEFKKELQNYKEQYEKFVRNDVDSFLERGLYSDAEHIAIAKERLEKMKKSYDSIATSLNKFEKENLGVRLKEMFDDLKTMDENEIDIYMINLASLEEQIINNKFFKGARIQKPTCESNPFCNDALLKHIKDSKISSAIEAAKKETMDHENQGRLYNQCMAQIVMKLSTSSDRQKTEKLVADVKSIMGKNVFSKFSVHSRKILEDYFQKNIVASNKSMNTAIGMSDPFENLKQYAEEELKNNYGGPSMNDEGALRSAFAMYDGIADNNNFGACSPKVDSNAFDAYLAYAKLKNLDSESKKMVAKLPPKDHIFISPFTCHHELRGRSVVAHELGHAINQIFASKKLSGESTRFYKKLRKCSTDNYVEFVPDRTLFSQKNDGERTEEDTADVFAYLAYPDPGDLFSCALIKPSLNNETYDELSFILDNGDSHSTPLYRLVMEAINKNKVLPVSCQRALEPFKKDLRLEKCVP